MAAEGGRSTCGVHSRGVSAKQRLHLAAVLIAAALFAPAVQAQSEVELDKGIHFQFGITQEEFDTFATLFAQGIYATPVEPARARGLLGFDVGIAAAAVPVDTNASYWTRSVNEDFTVSDHAVIPRLVASKGLSFGTISAMYAKVPDTDIQVWGASYDMPITNGGIAAPALTLRGAYSEVRGSEELKLKTYGAELFISKGFGPITPYAAAGYAKHDGTANVISLGTAPSYQLKTDGNMSRVTLGVKISMFIPKLVVEATQGEVRSYAAKVAFGF